jgi:hypothetical protein
MVNIPLTANLGRRVIEKLLIDELVKKFPGFYESLKVYHRIYQTPHCPSVPSGKFRVVP